jgi:hypothetical protein
MDHPVCHTGKMIIMGNNDKSVAEFLTEGEKQAVELLLILRVQVTGGFVG